MAGAREYYESTKNGAPLEGGVSGIKVVGDHTIEISLTKPDASFRKVLSPDKLIFPKEAYEKYQVDMRSNCIGTGAFVLEKVLENQQILLKRNENYWESDEHGNKLPYLEIVKVSFTPDKKAELTNFKKRN